MQTLRLGAILWWVPLRKRCWECIWLLLVAAGCCWLLLAGSKEWKKCKTASHPKAGAGKLNTNSVFRREKTDSFRMQNTVFVVFTIFKIIDFRHKKQHILRTPATHTLPKTTQLLGQCLKTPKKSAPAVS